jgi:hypothetical protein
MEAEMYGNAGFDPIRHHPIRGLIPYVPALLLVLWAALRIIV